MRTLAAELRRLRVQHEALVKKHAAINDHPFCWEEHKQHRALLRSHIAELNAYLQRVRSRNTLLRKRVSLTEDGTTGACRDAREALDRGS